MWLTAGAISVAWWQRFTGGPEQSFMPESEWLSFCDGGSPLVVRVEDLVCIGTLVRSMQGGVEVAVVVELSSEPCSHSGASGGFTTVNLLEMTGDLSDRLKPLEEVPLKLRGLDDDERLPLPHRPLNSAWVTFRLGLDDSPRTSSVNSLPTGSRSSAIDSPSSGASLCGACWVVLLPRSAVLQFAHRHEPSL